MTQADRVLALLRSSGEVTILDFPRGFRLAARIKDLRDAGHRIDTSTIDLPGGTKIARYTLRKTPTFAATSGVQEGLPL